MNILTDEQIVELITEANKATNSFKPHPLYEYEKFLIDAAYRETLKMVVSKLRKWQVDGTHLISNEAIEAFNQSGEE